VIQVHNDDPDREWAVKRLAQLRDRMKGPGPFPNPQKLRDDLGYVMQTLAFFDGWETLVAECEALLAKLPPPRFNCSDCGGRCCRGDLIIDLKPWEVPRFTVIPGLVRYRNDGPLGRTATLTPIHPDGRSQCLFLEKGRCGIYEERPLTCRCFVVGSKACRTARELF